MATAKKKSRKTIAAAGSAKAKSTAKKTAKKKTVAKTATKKTAKLPAALSTKLAAKRPATSKSPLVKLVEKALDDMKAVNVTVLDVRGLTDVADTMIIASGNSDRHVKSIAERVVYDAKQAGFRPMGMEGERDGEWALVDLNDVIVHVMLPRVREFYRLESLWDISAARREASV